MFQLLTYEGWPKILQSKKASMVCFIGYPKNDFTDIPLLVSKVKSKYSHDVLAMNFNDFYSKLKDINKKVNYCDVFVVGCGSILMSAKNDSEKELNNLFKFLKDHNCCEYNQGTEFMCDPKPSSTSLQPEIKTSDTLLNKISVQQKRRRSNSPSQNTKSKIVKSELPNNYYSNSSSSNPEDQLVQSNKAYDHASLSFDSSLDLCADDEIKPSKFSSIPFSHTQKATKLNPCKTSDKKFNPQDTDPVVPHTQNLTLQQPHEISNPSIQNPIKNLIAQQSPTDFHVNLRNLCQAKHSSEMKIIHGKTLTPSLKLTFNTQYQAARETQISSHHRFLEEPKKHNHKHSKNKRYHPYKINNQSNLLQSFQQQKHQQRQIKQPQLHQSHSSYRQGHQNYTITTPVSRLTQPQSHTNVHQTMPSQTLFHHTQNQNISTHSHTGAQSQRDGSSSHRHPSSSKNSH